MNSFRLYQVNKAFFRLAQTNNLIFRLISVSPPSYNDIKYLFDFLWVGGAAGDYLYSVTDSRRITIAGKDFAGNYIPDSSTATFTLPLDADFISSDTDNLWFDTLGNQRAVTQTELANWDYSRTLIKFDNDSPHHIRWIGLLNSAIILTADEINQIHHFFELSIFWSDVLNGYGRIKSNRTIDDHPIFLSAEIPSGHPTKVEITFNQDLFETLIPNVADFSLVGKIISLVEVVGNKVTLTVTVPYVDEVVTVDYAAPSINPLRSKYGGGIADSFIAQPVTNNLYGSELILNGGFDSDSVWTKGVGATILGGVGGINNTAGGQSGLLQNILNPVPTPYRVKFTITSISVGGGMGLYMGAAFGITYLTAGTFTENIISGGGIEFIVMTFWANTIAEVDNVSVKEIL